MRRRQRTERILGVLSLAVGLALIAVSLGVGARSSSAASQKNFTNLRVVLDTIDYLDPARAYTAQSAGIEFAAFNTLVTYPHKDKAHGGGKLVPGLAAAMPRISRNGKTYIFKLRPGLRYSNGKALKASDFRSTIERLYPATSQGVGFYKAIVGASAYADRCAHGCSGHIGGIIANNAKRTVTFKLTTPRGDFLSTLALQFTIPVPAGTSADDQSTKNLPSIGPYHIINYVPNQGFTLVRNKYFKPSRFVPRPGPDKITVKLIGDANAATQQVINGQADYSNGAIPPDRIGAITRRYGKRLKLAQQANTYYFWMNNRSPVFKKLKARLAVEYAMNRTAMIRAVYGGLGRPTQQVLPPNYPQYRKLNLYKGPNLAKARQLVRQAGVNGAHITVWGRAVTDSQQAVTLMASTLESIGFKTTIKILPRATYYTTIGNEKTADRDIGWARWLEDYPHPSDWFDVLLNGNRITAQNNNNYSETNVGKINRMIERLNKLPLSAKVNNQWAQVDKLVMQNASWAPWVNRLFPHFFGSKVNMSSVDLHPIYQFDYSMVRSK